MAFSTLPLDVVDAVCHFLDTGDLLSLCRTNSLFTPFAQRLVFRHISIHSPSQAVQCIKTLSKERDLALLVRTFSLRLDSSQPIFGSFVHMLATALSGMSNMTSLDLVLYPSASAALLCAVPGPGDVKYLRLEHFACSFPLDKNVSAFLQRTPLLSELHLGGDGDVTSATYPPSVAPYPLPATALPRLSVFIGSCEAASALVPGRPLESVHVHSGDMSDEVLSALSQSTATISIFGALTRSLSPSLLLSLASNLPDLRHLRIMTMYHSSNHNHDEVFYAQVVRILGSLPNLVTAELAGIHWDSWKKQTLGVRSNWRDKPIDTSDGATGLDESFDIADEFSSY